MKRITITLLSCLMFGHPAGADEFRFSPRPNKAHQIQWRSWNQAALAEARTKDRLILLSLSAVWCHWCHVMDETSYSDDEIIGFLNENFIPIRVDADMRPDIDTLYNQGGWPSTAILTPEGEVISGGNYIDPEELLGRLKRAAALYQSDRSMISRRLDEMKAQKEARTIRESGFHHMPDGKVIEEIVRVLKDAFDEEHGGFGTGQKFPNPDAIDFLMSVYVKNGDKQIKRIVTKTLNRMAGGAIFDKREGGFFRYATRSDWSEPHYEKMLEVNAGMIRNYANAGRVFRNDRYLGISRRCIEYVKANLSDPATGAFFGSQDADETYYRTKERKSLKQPFVDRTVYSDSASLLISALVTEYEATGEKEYLDSALAGADFLLKNLYSEKEGLFHYYREGAKQIPGMLSDNALFGSALLDLYNATGRREFVQKAAAIARLLVKNFYDDGGKRFQTSLHGPETRPVLEGILLSMNENLANYRTISFLNRAVYYAEIEGLKADRDAALMTLADEYKKFTPHAGSFGNVLLWSAFEPVEITILTGKKGGRKYLDAVGSVFVPEKIVRVLSIASDRKEIERLRYGARESVYLCAGKRCSKPILSTEKLKEELISFTSSSFKK